MSKHSNPDLHTSNYTLIKTSDSQVLTPPDSLSLPSEPPDIRNWFSSYGYESPKVNIGENLEICDSIRGNDSESEGYHVEKNNRRKEDNLGLLRKLERRVSEGFVRCKNSDGNDNSTKTASQVLGSPDSHLLISEPPDIKNWFSSYVYESPALDTSDDFGFPDYEKSKVDREEFNSEKISKAGEDSMVSIRTRKKDDVVGKMITSSKFIKCNRIVENNKDRHQFIHQGDNGVGGRENFSVLNDLPSKKISEQILEGKRAQDRDDCLTKDAEKPSFLNTDSAQKLWRELPVEAFHRSSDIKEISVNNAGISTRKLICGWDSFKEFSEAKAHTEDESNLSAQSTSDMLEVNDNSWRRTRSKNKENAGNDFSANNFVSTRKGRYKIENDENLLKSSGGDQPQLFGNRVLASSVGQKDVMVRRKVLSETTNLQHSDLSEITGKWKCPRKNKPDLGPPLKQLRLEQWVHRV